jgi:hypothetical protein
MTHANAITRPATWLLYLAIACEFLFMISPLGLHFYAAYQTPLELLDRSPFTA